MRRSPLRRRAPLKSGGRIKPRSDKRAEIAPERAAFVDRILRVRPDCEACPVLNRVGIVPSGAVSWSPHRAQDVHELVRRSAGSPIVPSQGLADADVLSVCRASHDWIGLHPPEAVDLGLARWGMRANPVVSRLPSGVSDSTPKERHGMEIVYRGTVDLERRQWIVTRHASGVTMRLRHVKRHSRGFAWGYEGSAPAELARCLLIDALDHRAVCESCEGSGHVQWIEGAAAVFRAAREGEIGEMVTECHDCAGSGYAEIVERVYQSFKRDVVAGWPQTEPWEIGRAEIVAYAEARMAELATRA